MNNLPSILGGLAQGFVDFGKSAVDLFGTGGAAIGDLIQGTGTKNQDDFRKWLYQTDDTKDAAAKGLGTALNGAQTVLDYIPGIGAVTKNPLFNAGQGALGGLADEFKTYGKDYDLGRAGQRAAVSAGGALASSGLADALKKSANPLMSSGAVQGLARGATGGAISGGGYAAIDGGDIYNSALQGAGMGALIGGATGLAQDFKPAKTYDVALTDEEKAARIANIDNQLSRLDTTSPDGAARYDELMRARSVYSAPADKIQTLYHQTSANSFEEFSPEKRASGVMDQGTPTGIFLKENNNDIGLPGKNQLQFDVKMENPYQVDSRDALANYARSRSKTYADLYDQAVELDKKSADVYNEFTNKLDDVYKKYYYEQDATKKAALKKDVDYLIKNIKSLSEEKASEYRRQGADVARKAQDELNRVLREDGYDSVVLANDEGSFGRKIKSYIALSPYEQMAEIKKMPLETTLSDADMAVNNPKYLVDENGNPRTFYHGSPETNITEFDMSKAGRNTRSGEHAFYFTDSPEVADEFSYERIPTDSMFIDKVGKKGKVYPANLSMNNPLDLDNLSDAQIRELWEYASPMGKLNGEEGFIRDMTNFRDKYHNAQGAKLMLDLDKLQDSQYDGFMATMYPNQANKAREYAVFDNSKIKMLEDVLAADDAILNNAPDSASIEDSASQLSLFDDYAPKPNAKVPDVLDDSYMPVDGKTTQAMRDRAYKVLESADNNTILSNELRDRIDASTLPQGDIELRNIISSSETPDVKYQKIIEMLRGGNVDDLLDFTYGGDKDIIAKAKSVIKKRGLSETGAKMQLSKEAVEKAKRLAYDSVDAGYTATADTLLSERLGIAPSTTYKHNNKNPKSFDKKNANGRYKPLDRDISVKEYSNKTSIRKMPAEQSLSTTGHERLHSFQNEANTGSAGRYDQEVIDAYNQLHKEIEPLYNDAKKIKQFHANKNEYYARPIEQEARMFQQYLEDRGYTDKTLGAGKREFSTDIYPAFDKFIDKLRDLSKRGVALPALAALFGGGAYMASQDKEKEAK